VCGFAGLASSSVRTIDLDLHARLDAQAALAKEQQNDSEESESALS
jgi:hypothetical protein